MKCDPCDYQRKKFQAEGMISAKVLRQEYTLCAQGKAGTRVAGVSGQQG